MTSQRISGLLFALVLGGCSSSSQKPTAPDTGRLVTPPTETQVRGSDETTISREAPPSKTLSGVVEIEIGSAVYNYAGCLVRKSKTVWCWGGPGGNAYELGRSIPKPGPSPVLDLSNVASLQVAGSEICAIKENGRVACWRGPQLRELSIGSVVALSGGSGFMCALLRDGNVQCRGTNLNGEIGRPPQRRGIEGGIKMGDWGPVPGVTSIVQISGTCALRHDGSLLCWGAHILRPEHDWEDTHQFMQSIRPMVLADLPKAKRFAMDHKRICLLKENDRVVCFQRDAFDKPVVQQDFVVDKVVDLQIGLGGVVFLTKAGALHYWGIGPTPNGIDQAWIKKRHARFDPKVTRLVPGMGPLVAFSSGLSHVCGLTKDQRALCWGENANAQLNNGELNAPKQATHLIDHHPALMSGPGEKMFGCKAEWKVRRSCTALAGPEHTKCDLVAPLGYWSWGGGGGALCGEKCMNRAAADLQKRATPACVCTCSDEYQRALQEQNRRLRVAPPPAMAPR